MNYIRHLNHFFHYVKQDDRLTAMHVSLYMGLFQVWNSNRFKQPFPVYRDHLLKLSRIGSKNTYHKCLKELQSAGYIQVQPGLSKYMPAKIYMRDFEKHAAPVVQSDLFLEYQVASSKNQDTSVDAGVYQVASSKYQDAVSVHGEEYHGKYQVASIKYQEASVDAGEYQVASSKYQDAVSVHGEEYHGKYQVASSKYQEASVDAGEYQVASSKYQDASVDAGEYQVASSENQEACADAEEYQVSSSKYQEACVDAEEYQVSSSKYQDAVSVHGEEYHGKYQVASIKYQEASVDAGVYQVASSKYQEASVDLTNPLRYDPVTGPDPVLNPPNTGTHTGSDMRPLDKPINIIKECKATLPVPGKKNQKERKGPFPPDQNLVEAFFRERGQPPNEAKKFYLYYQSIGWRVQGGATPITDWKAAAEKWLLNDKTYYNNADSQRNSKTHPNPYYTRTDKDYSEPL